MNVRRLVLRLAVGLLCFAIGWASAVMLGAAGARRTIRRVRHVVVPHAEAPPPMPFKSGCRAFRARHAHEWREVPRHEEEFDLRLELEELPPPPLAPPAPPAPPRRK